MFVAMPTATITIEFADRGANVSHLTLYFAVGIPDATLQAGMAIVIDRLEALTDARISAWKVTRKYENDEPNNAPIGTDLLRKIALFYREAEICEGVFVPGGKLSLMEVTGPYAGIRLDATRPDVADLLQLWQEIVSFIVTPEGDEFPQNYVVGGLTL